ncbi:MAG: MATE family efflux transporter [Clostridia bacterium]|nr:MATE family efflux transporter [Clostridia bacterium]
MMLKKFIGDKLFYKQVFTLMIPILIQNGITNFVNMLDNLMVGQVGQTEMIGVSVANQLIFVFNLCIFGAVSGAGIFGAQFVGSGDTKGLRDTFRFKVIFCTSLTAGVILLFFFGGDFLINLYLKGEGSADDVALSFRAGRDYLNVMLVGLIPASLVQCYSSTLRETGKTMPPMVAGLIAVGVNLVFNYILIFGHFGAPKLGVVGAAIATVFSRFVELAIVAIWTHKNKETNKFIIGAYISFRVPLDLVKKIAQKGLPLMLNETMWAAGLAFVNQCYSEEGLAVVAANNIVQTFFNVFAVAFQAVGVSIGIVLGQLLGAGKIKDVKESSVKLIAFSVFISLIVMVAFFVSAEFIPDLYKLDPDVRILATRLMQICALAIPFDAIANASYFTLRSGGQAIITIIFDSGFVWVTMAPLAFVLCTFTGLTIIPIFACCQAMNALKAALGLYFVKKEKWIKKIVA